MKKYISRTTSCQKFCDQCHNDLNNFYIICMLYGQLKATQRNGLCLSSPSCITSKYKMTNSEQTQRIAYKVFHCYFGLATLACNFDQSLINLFINSFKIWRRLFFNFTRRNNCFWKRHVKGCHIPYKNRKKRK